MADTERNGAPREPRAASQPRPRFLRDRLGSPLGIALIGLTYLFVGGMIWLVAEARAATRPPAVQAAAQPAPTVAVALTPTTVLPTAVPQPTARPAPTVTARPAPLPTKVPYAVEPPATGKFILIDQDRQRMFVFEDGVERFRFLISSGVPGSRMTDTPKWSGKVTHYVGTFFAYGGFADDAWYLFKDYVGDILIHGAPYKTVNGKKVYKDIEKLGISPASRGCIRLYPDDIERLTGWNPQGVKVTITPWTGTGPARLLAPQA